MKKEISIERSEKQKLKYLTISSILFQYLLKLSVLYFLSVFSSLKDVSA